MFRPNTTCTLYPAGGKTTVFGQTVPGAAVEEPCAIVKLAPKVVKTPVSTRVSASRDAAEEVTADAVILLGAKTVANRNDVFAIDGMKYRIVGMTPQHALDGRLDHYETHAVIYSQT
jgi:hypothetical protein